MAPSDAAMYASLRETVGNVLDTLTPREAKVLRMRFGIEMNTDHTLEEVGKTIRRHPRAHSPDRSQALRKLRHPTRSGTLEELPRQRTERRRRLIPALPVTPMPLAPSGFCFCGCWPPWPPWAVFHRHLFAIMPTIARALARFRQWPCNRH